jgi:DNA-binding beta-propeller fold protein YncE
LLESGGNREETFRFLNRKEFFCFHSLNAGSLMLLPSAQRNSRPARSRRWLIAAALMTLMATAAFLSWYWLRSQPPKPLVAVVTVAGVGPKISSADLSDPFGVAADEDGNLFISDGAGGRIHRVPAEGAASVIAEGLDMPSAVALAPDGTLVVANTGAHTIARVDPPTGRVSLIAGAPGMSGEADGAHTQARFNAPVGVAVGKDGTIFVADTYNDRIRAIARDGRVRTLAGASEPGYQDGIGTEARFDTPCGIAVAPDGALLIADTGNHRIRRVTLDGAVTTLAGTGEAMERDGLPQEAAFAELTAIAVRDAQSFYVADAAGASVRLCAFGKQPDAQPGEEPSVTTLAGGFPNGLADGDLASARLDRPTGLALMPDGALVFADSGNGLVRAFIPREVKLGFRAEERTATLTAAEIRAAVPPRWPFHPPTARREIAGTFGEIRGERQPEHDAWFHNGLDIPGGYGEVVRAIFTERVSRPLAVEGVGGLRERLRLPLIGYTHVRLGRDQNDRPLADDRFSFRRDEQGRIIGVRVRRGARINAGDAIGTLNRLNHVHLIAGPASAEINALAALELPGLVDTVPPVIESVMLTTANGEPLTEPTLAKAQGKRSTRGARPSNKQAERIPARGRLRIIARAYDQVDGNARYRRLGIYRLGYTVLNADGSPAPGYAEPRYNIVFERLPADPRAAAIAYAEGSQSGYSGTTVFAYTITNVVRDGQAREDFWDAAALAPGDYIVRVIAEDFFGNRATRDILVSVLKE